VADTRDASSDAHRRAIEASTAEMAAFLQDALGQKLVAYTVGAATPKSISRWASGEQSPRPDKEQRLRNAFQVFHLLTAGASREMARAWFIGSNPHLEDQTPADAIRAGGVREVMNAARVFAERGTDVAGLRPGS
jgi:hypothetical protein